MGLDYWSKCVNFRDVGEWVNEIAGKRLLPTGHILRGGTIAHISSAAEIGEPGTIFNLRKGDDPESQLFNADYFHFPISNDYEKYETTTPEVRKWLQEVIKTIETDLTKFPLFIHCTSGKDRTGVVVASLLRILGIDLEIIVEEYMLSQGDVKREWIETALAGIADLESYFRRTNLDIVRHKILPA